MAMILASAGGSDSPGIHGTTTSSSSAQSTSEGNGSRPPRKSGWKLGKLILNGSASTSAPSSSASSINDATASGFRPKRDVAMTGFSDSRSQRAATLSCSG